MESRAAASVAHDGREVREAAAGLVRRLARARPSPAAHLVLVEVGRAAAVRLTHRAAAHGALAAELRLDRLVRDADQQRQHLCTEDYSLMIILYIHCTYILCSKCINGNACA